MLQLPHLIAQTADTPALCTLFFGANDAAVPASSHYVPMEEYQSNLAAMIGMMQSAWPACPIVLITPPPVDQEAWDSERGGPGRGQRELERARKYGKAAVEVAIRLNCQYIDLLEHIHARVDWKECLSDGLHLSASGNEELFQCVVGVIISSAPDLQPDCLPVHFPLWSDLAAYEDGPQSLITPLTIL